LFEGLPGRECLTGFGQERVGQVLVALLLGPGQDFEDFGDQLANWAVGRELEVDFLQAVF
jgi:hypothetical protein